MNGISIRAGSVICAVGLTFGISQARADNPGASLSEADRLAVFKAAGAVQRQGRWVVCADDPNTRGAVIDTAARAPATRC